MTESKPFQCLSCNKQYTALNSKNVEEAQGIVKKIIEAELRGGKLLILDWSTSTTSYPYSFLSLKNNGASDAKDVAIQIKLQIDKERRDIGTYKFEKINPDKLVIEKSDPKLDPMRKSHDILKEMKLIHIYSQETERIATDQYGEEYCVPEYFEWKEIRKEFSCNFEVNLSYLLGTKKIIEQSRYFLEFKFREIEPGEDNREEEDNCEIHMRQSE